MRVYILPGEKMKGIGPKLMGINEEIIPCKDLTGSYRHWWKLEKRVRKICFGRSTVSLKCQRCRTDKF